MNKTYYGDEAKGLRYPAINEMIEKASNKYELVIATAKRARELIDDAQPLVDMDIDNPVSIATREIYEDKVRIISHIDDEPTDSKDEDALFEAAETAEAPTIAEMAEDEELL